MKRAFTLVELLVIIAIVSILTAMGVSGYVGSRNNRAVIVQAEELRNIIAEAKSLSISPPTKASGDDILTVSAVEVRITNTVPPTVGIYIVHSGNPAGTLYRDYSGFDKVRFDSGNTIKFDNQGQTVNDVPTTIIRNLSSSNPIEYNIDVNKSGFANITKP